jgi:hypothetical protein
MADGRFNPVSDGLRLVAKPKGSLLVQDQSTERNRSIIQAGFDRSPGGSGSPFDLLADETGRTIQWVISAVEDLSQSTGIA